MKKFNLYLDDVRTPIDGDWIIVRSYEEFVKHINLHGLDNFETISLDHDLGEEAMKQYFENVKPNYYFDYSAINEKTGYDAAKFLVEVSMQKEVPLPQIYVHSANPIGSANIMGYINNYLMNCKLPQTCIRVQIRHKIEKMFK